MKTSNLAMYDLIIVEFSGTKEGLTKIKLISLKHIVRKKY
jgi:hypothetical protein